MKGIHLILIFFFLGIAHTISGQQSAFHAVCLSIPEIAIVDIEPNTSPISLSLVPPNEAGSTLTSTSSNVKWINYSSSLPTGAAPRTILVQTQSNLPSGLSLRLLASNYSGNGGGALGASNGTVSLNTIPKSLISGIGGAYTGNGQNNGHQLTFSLAITNFQLLDAANSGTVTVIYTITD